MRVNLSSTFQSAVYILLLGGRHHKACFFFVPCTSQITWQIKVYGLTNPGGVVKETLVREGSESDKSQ